VIGAFDRERAIGFALSVAAHRNGELYLHSHMTAMLPEYQNRGIGRQLKLAQREDALSRGINLIEWTFDPLQLRNAHFNIARLGAIVREYLPNVYGRTSSPLHHGLPTDRLVAQWRIRDPRVEQMLSNQGLNVLRRRSRFAFPETFSKSAIRMPKKPRKYSRRSVGNFSRCLLTVLGLLVSNWTSRAESTCCNAYENRIRHAA
jgi:predicted GNAT superfamily acetyltransferase